MGFTNTSILILIFAFGLKSAIVLADAGYGNGPIKDTAKAEQRPDTAKVEQRRPPTDKILEDFEKFESKDYDPVEDDTETNALQLNMDMHNDLRRIHHVNPLTRNATLDKNAKRCAKYYLERGMIDHTCPDIAPWGDNLYKITGARSSDEDMVMISVREWYSELSDHDFNQDTREQVMRTGHFTQMVWAASKEVGYGIYSDGQITVGVALYSPKGNILGRFRENVFAK